MATTMNLIAKQTVGSGGAASITFSNIPQTFTDLKIVLSTRSTHSGVVTNCSIAFNGSTSSFSQKMLSGDGSNTNSYSRTDNLNFTMANAATSTGSVFSNEEIYIPNYTTSNNKSFGVDSVTENNATEAYAQFKAGLWSDSAAITSFTVTSQNGIFTEFTTVYLYGISNSSTQNTSVPLASGGDVITTDGSYWYHTFLSSGTFTPQKNLTCDYLVVAGGGGGGTVGSGYGGGGGGGAGGYRTSIGGTPLSLTTQVYTATIGAGGAGAVSVTARGSNGGNSIFSTITSSGGGGGGSGDSPTSGAAGGSGGGGYSPSAGGAGNAGSYTPVEGYAGGAGASGSAYAGGGGGGSSAVGSSATSSTNGASGGNGTANSISGTSVTYAGGGGGGKGISGGSGGTGGTGGGGTGSGSSAATTGTANLGGGGGGGSQSSFTGAAGGSGIIIVRYAV